MKQNETLEKAIANGMAKVQLGRFIDKYTRHEVQKRAGCNIPKEAFQIACNYWKERRYNLGEGKRPLIRRLLIETEDEKKKQELELNKRRFLLKERTDLDKYKTLRSIREDLELARTIIDRIRIREKKKLERLHLCKQKLNIYYEQVQPLQPVIVYIKLFPEVRDAIAKLRGIPEKQKSYEDTTVTQEVSDVIAMLTGFSENHNHPDNNIKKSHEDEKTDAPPEEEQSSKTQNHRHKTYRTKHQQTRDEPKKQPKEEQKSEEDHTDSNMVPPEEKNSRRSSSPEEHIVQTKMCTEEQSSVSGAEDHEKDQQPNATKGKCNKRKAVKDINNTRPRKVRRKRRRPPKFFF